jgi:hypothetical protein
MRRIFSAAIIALLALGVLAVLYNAQHQAINKGIQDEGNGIFHQKKQETAAAADHAALRAAAAEMSGYSNSLERGAYDKTTGVSGPAWKDRLEKVIEDSVRAIKNLATIFGHRIRPHLAPPGVYFTRLYLSVPSPFGITGIRAGTRVVCVKDDGAVLLVKMGNFEFEAKREYLTNDLDIADLASRNDAQAQQAVASSIAQQHALDQARRDEENAALDQRQEEIAAQRAAAEAARGSFSNPLNRGAYGETTGVSGPPSVGGFILPQSTVTQSTNLTVPKPAPTP